LVAGRAWRTPYLSWEQSREEKEGYIWKAKVGRLLLKLGLILLCALLIFALILVVPVASGSVLA
jgi:hypothetical protein